MIVTFCQISPLINFAMVLLHFLPLLLLPLLLLLRLRQLFPLPLQPFFTVHWTARLSSDPFFLLFPILILFSSSSALMAVFQFALPLATHSQMMETRSLGQCKSTWLVILQLTFSEGLPLHLRLFLLYPLPCWVLLDLFGSLH